MKAFKRTTKPKAKVKTKVGDTPSTNLNKPVRGQKVAREFKMSQEMSIEFDIKAAEKGFNRRQGSDFLKEVWEFWMAHQ